MKARIVFVIVPVLFLLAGCGIPFNTPAVGPHGDIAVFLDRTGRYAFTPERGTLALIRDGTVTSFPGVSATGSCGAISWSPDGKAVTFVDTEPGEFGLPAAWMIEMVPIQTNSHVTTIVRSEFPLIGPAFTPLGNITYIEVDENGDGWLTLYDRASKAERRLLDNVISYRPAREGSSLWVIRRTSEDNISIGHLIQYDPQNGDADEIARFFIGTGVDLAFQVFPGAFFFDIAPTEDYIALTLFDQVLIEPELDEGEPSLYLIDVGDGTAERIAARGISPAFSPNGAVIAYIGSEDGADHSAYLYTIGTQRTERVPVTGIVNYLFWIDQHHLGLVVQDAADESSYRLLMYGLTTNDVVPLLPG